MSRHFKWKWSFDQSCFSASKEWHDRRKTFIIRSRNCCCAFTSLPTTSLCILSAKIFTQWLFGFLRWRGVVAAAGLFPQLAVWSLSLPLTKGSFCCWWVSSFHFSIKNCWFSMINTVPLSCAVLFNYFLYCLVRTTAGRLCPGLQQPWV